MNRARVSVVKLGGSLLASADFPTRLRRWLAAEQAGHPNTHLVFVVGGGKFVEAIRETDAQSPLDEELAHWLCVDLMNITARLVGALLPELSVVDDFAVLDCRVREPGITLFAPSQFLRQVEPTCAGTRLAADWSVTSDSIAGRLAIVLDAEQFVMMKSAPPPIQVGGGNYLELLVATGYVDEFLGKLEEKLPSIRFLELEREPAHAR